MRHQAKERVRKQVSERAGERANEQADSSSVDLPNEPATPIVKQRHHQETTISHVARGISHIHLWSMLSTSRCLPLHVAFVVCRPPSAGEARQLANRLNLQPAERIKTAQRATAAETTQASKRASEQQDKPTDRPTSQDATRHQTELQMSTKQATKQLINQASNNAQHTCT
jgi:hypothetical protein